MQGFPKWLRVPVHDAPPLKRLLLPLNVRSQLPIPLRGEPLYALRRVEGCSLQRELVVLQLGVTSVNGGDFRRLKSVLIQQRLGALLVVQERDNLFIDLRIQPRDENDNATTSSRLRGALLAEVHGTALVQSGDQGRSQTSHRAMFVSSPIPLARSWGGSPTLLS